MKSKLTFLLLTLIWITTFNACNKMGSLDKTVDQGKELASRGDVTVHQGYLDLLTRVNPALANQIKTPSGKKRLVDSLLEQELMYQESVNRGVPKKPQAQEKAALYQRVIFGQALVDDVLEATTKEYYEKNKETEFQQVKIAQILIKKAPAPKAGKNDKAPPPAVGPTDEEALKKAQAAEAKLKSGTPWEVVVTEYSDDAASKAKGGEIGAISKSDRRIQFLDWKALVDKAFTMQVGEVSEPIPAKDGYHIIKVIEASSITPYEEVQTQLKFKMRGYVKNELLNQLTKDQKVVYKDPELQALAKPEAPEKGMMMEMEGGDAAETNPSKK